MWGCPGHELREAAEYSGEIPGGVVDELEKGSVEGAGLDEESSAGTDDLWDLKMDLQTNQLRGDELNRGADERRR